MEVNVAINIKVETFFGGGMYFVRAGGWKIARGGGNISSPGDSVMGETLFRDKSAQTNKQQFFYPGKRQYDNITKS